ncbi:hypothetical protein Egran_00061 [Elaphomyces granulatus]|uniref:Hydrophobin n=1 Tax=Elaphomyces granulatus TaxID=519963 RepID=A0A232M767_9EURO|nr:hypothetical protein Egran_00061 [Elaphomyces granulatus]
MHFNTINALCSFFFAFLVGGGMASPITETSLEPRALLPISVGGNQAGGCPQVGGPVTQSNKCSSGTSFCCSPTNSGGHNCVNTNTTCDSTVICCNNNGNGTQICIGTANINLNMPINIHL